MIWYMDQAAFKGFSIFQGVQWKNNTSFKTNQQITLWAICWMSWVTVGAYKIVCTICPSSVYEGETSMCLYERGKKHLSEFSSGVQSNCMVIHNFRMKGLRHIGRPLDRQIDEAMRIKNSSATVVMNSGAEWRQPAIPRASFSAPGLERRITNKE